MILNGSACNFCFLIMNPPHIHPEKLLILIHRPKIFSSNQNQFVLVSNTELWLDQSDSKIIETLITQEQSKLFNFFFAYGHKSRGVTNQSSFFKFISRHAQKLEAYYTLLNIKYLKPQYE